MMQAIQVVASKPPLLQSKAGDSKLPSCCGREMQVLQRRAVLHSDGSVDYKTALGCECCGRRIL